VNEHDEIYATNHEEWEKIKTKYPVNNYTRHLNML
jgi:hypothetical protein